MSLLTPETVRKRQTALHTKAKESPAYRFYALYDKVCNRMLAGTHPGGPAARCTRCGTLHRWTLFQDTGFSFIMPPKEAPLLPTCRDLTGLA